MSTMEEYTRRIERDMPVSLPQFKTREEVIAHARQRYLDKRGRTTSGSSQGNASTGVNPGQAIRRDTGNGGGYPTNGAGADSERGAQTYAVYAGDGRDAAGAGSTDGYFDQPTVSDRVVTNIRTGSDKYDRPAGGVSEPEVHAPTRRKGPGLKSKIKGFTDTAFGPIQQKEEVSVKNVSPRGRGKYKTLSADEVKTLRPRLIEYLTWQTEHADQFIIATTKGHDPTIEIWGNMDEAEIEILADFLINRGRRDAVTAQAVRFAAEIMDRVKVAIIVLPRVYRTVSIYLARGLDIPIFVR